MSKEELLKSFRKQLDDLREQAKAKENQLLGAIYALEQLAEPDKPKGNLAPCNGEFAEAAPACE